MKIKIIAIIVAVVLVAGIGAGVGFSIYNNMPENVAARAVSGAVEDIFERDEIEPICKMLTGGSLSLSVGEISSDTEGVLFDGSISGKIYFSKNALMLKDARFEYEDISVSGDAYVSDEMLYISESEILEGAYGVRFEDFARDLENSIFAYGSDSDYAFEDQEMYDRIIEYFEDFESSEDMEKDAEKLLKKHGKELWKIVCDNVEFEVETDNVRLNGEKKSVRVISIIVDGHAMSNIIADVYDYLCEDETIGEFLDEYGDGYSLLMSEELSGDDEEVLDSLDEDKTLGEIYEEYLESLEDKIEDICHDIESDIDADLTFKIITPKHSDKLLRLEVEVDGGDILTVDFGEKGVKNTDKITVRAGDFKLTYEIDQNDRDAYESKLKINGETVCEIYVDKDDKEYSLSLGDGQYVIRGDFTTSHDTTTITVNEMTEKYEAYSEMIDGWTEITKTTEYDITIVIDEKDKMPSEPKDYDRISDITEEDIEGWYENLESILAKIPEPIE